MCAEKIFLRKPIKKLKELNNERIKNKVISYLDTTSFMENMENILYIFKGKKQ